MDETQLRGELFNIAQNMSARARREMDGPLSEEHCFDLEALQQYADQILRALGE